MKLKHEQVWKSKVNSLVDELEASRLSIQNLIQENMALKIALQHTSDEAAQSVEEAKHKLHVQIERLKKENETLHNGKIPRIQALESELLKVSKDNSKLRHKVQVS